MRVALLGFGDVEGPAALRYWRESGAEVTVLDQRDKAVPEGSPARFGAGYDDNLDDFDLIVRTPMILPYRIKTMRPVTSVIKEFFARCPAPIIGVTGTKGKGTTATLIAQLLESTARRVWLGGNIGIAPLDFLPHIDTEDWVVLELSSFQLFDLEQSPSVAVCLMITPEHLNVHRTHAEYVSAKSSIFRYQRSDGTAVYHAGDATSHHLGALSRGRKVPYFGDERGSYVNSDWLCLRQRRIIPLDELGLVGKHNWENAAAAVAAVADLGIDDQTIADTLRSFTGLPHRLEYVGEVDMVRYYDDSISTTPEAAIAALEAFDAPKLIILGGADKGAQYSQLARRVAAGDVKWAALVGATASPIRIELERAGFRSYSEHSDMDSAVSRLQSLAVSGDTVLLAPGCASFGLFRDYKDRGDQFKAAIKGLEPGS